MVQGVFVPSIPRGALNAAASLIGAIIMPHNLYLHSALVLTRNVNPKSKREVNEANIYNNIESAISLFVSFIINTAVISTFASYVAKRPGDKDADLDLLQASDALQDLFGEGAKYIWALGLLAAG